MMGNLIAAKSMLLLQASPAGPSQMTGDQQFQIAMEGVRHGVPGGGAAGILALLVPFAFFAMVFGIVWITYRNAQARMQAQTVFHKQLLDKFGSTKEFGDFLESKGGQRFLETLWSRSQSSFDRVLRTMRTGTVMTALGLGALALSWTRGPAGLRVLGVLVLALGIGFLISAAISHHLSQRWAKQIDSERPSAS